VGELRAGVRSARLDWLAGANVIERQHRVALSMVRSDLGSTCRATAIASFIVTAGRPHYVLNGATSEDLDSTTSRGAPLLLSGSGRFAYLVRAAGRSCSPDMSTNSESGRNTVAYSSSFEPA